MHQSRAEVRFREKGPERPRLTAQVMDSNRAEVTPQPPPTSRSSVEPIATAGQTAANGQNVSSSGVRRVLLVDAHPVFRLGIRGILRQLSDFTVCGEAGTAAEAMQLFQSELPHVVVMDACLPGGTGTEILRAMLLQNPAAAILVISQHEEPLYAALALSAGAIGYARKDDPLKSLCSALRKTARHELHVSRSLRQHILIKALLEAGGGTRDFLAPLSSRELDVFNCLGQGLDTHEIARQLDLGVKTVDTHRANIKKKLHLADAASTSRLATEWYAMTGIGEKCKPEAGLPDTSINLR